MSGRRRIWIWIWILIPFDVLLLLAIAWPLLAQDKGPHRSICLSNLKQLALANLMYAEDSDGKPPICDKWMDLVHPYSKNEQIFHCDKVEGAGLYGYALNAGLKSLNAPADTSKSPLLYDSVNLARNASDFATSLPVPGRHNGGNYVAYADSHVRYTTDPSGKPPGDR